MLKLHAKQVLFQRSPFLLNPTLVVCNVDTILYFNAEQVQFQRLSFQLKPIWPIQAAWYVGIEVFVLIIYLYCDRSRRHCATQT